MANVEKLRKAYQDWKIKHEQDGGDRNVVIGLGYSKGLSAQFTKAQGAAKLDLIDASVDVEVRGLDNRVDWDVWLVDNRPGPGHSVMPEPGDLMLNAGRLTHEGEVAKLETDLGDDALREFQVDLMVVAREGDDPGKSGVLFGSSGLFQRLYTLERSEQLAMVSDYQPANRLLAENWWTPLLGFGRVFAPTIVNPDVLMDPMVAHGAELFFNETFDGNGRNCGTCHPASNNFTIDRAFIATLPKDDPLFVAEFIPELAENFEKPKLMRDFGLILENQDGFDDLKNHFNMRGVPHTLGLRTSVDSVLGPRTGWAGDGSPKDGSLRSFAIGAVRQHFTKTLARLSGDLGNDFRLPTDEELDALRAFQFSLGRQEDLTLPLPLKGTALRGQEIFNDPTLGKCSACHSNAGANGDPNIFGADAGNLNFNTGVEDLPDKPADPKGELMDDGFVTSGEFNTPSLVESADTGPFFHNNSVETIEGAVAFYNGDAFNNSPAGQLLVGATGSGINLDATQVEAVVDFLRVINARENIRFAAENLKAALHVSRPYARDLLKQAAFEIDDGTKVISDVAFHGDAVKALESAATDIRKGRSSRFRFIRNLRIRRALRHLDNALMHTEDDS